MISLAQVVAAIAVGVMLPVTALLTVEVHRLRQRSQADGQIARPSTPERVVDDDANHVEAIARLAAARFELVTHEQDDIGLRSKAHLTLITRPLRSGKKRSASCPAAEARRPSTHRPAEAAARVPGRVTRD